MAKNKPINLPGYISDEMYEKYKDLYDMAIRADEMAWHKPTIDTVCPNCKNLDRPYWMCEKCNGIGFIEE